MCPKRPSNPLKIPKTMTEFFSTLEAWDKAATLAINSWSCPASDAFWLFMSNKRVWFPMYAVFVALLIWKLGWKRGLAMVLATVLCITCVDQFCNLIKAWAARLRPCCDPQMLEWGVRVLEPHHPNYLYGFFSAHAANSIAFALCMVYAFRSWRDEHPEKARLYTIGSIILIVWAVLVGVSRIFVAKHFLGDVLVGFAVGSLLALALSYLTAFILKRLRVS